MEGRRSQREREGENEKKSEKKTTRRQCPTRNFRVHSQMKQWDEPRFIHRFEPPSRTVHPRRSSADGGLCAYVSTVPCDLPYPTHSVIRMPEHPAPLYR